MVCSVNRITITEGELSIGLNQHRSTDERDRETDRQTDRQADAECRCCVDWSRPSVVKCFHIITCCDFIASDKFCDRPYFTSVYTYVYVFCFLNTWSLTNSSWLCTSIASVVNMAVWSPFQVSVYYIYTCIFCGKNYRWLTTKSNIENETLFHT